LKCPLLFYYRHVLGIRVAERPIPLVFGGAIHKAVELYEKNGDDPLEVFEDNFEPDKIDYFDRFGRELSTRQADDVYETNLENGFRLLDHFVEERETGILKDYEVVSTERYFRRRLRHPITHDRVKVRWMTGIVDFILEDGRFGDYKTSGKTYKQATVDESLQPTMYYLWYYLTYRRLPKSFVYIVFLKRRKTNPIQVLETHRTLTQLGELVDLINEIAVKVEKKQFKRSHGEKAYCDCFRYEKLLNV